MKTVTLNDLLNDVKAIEARTKEPPEITEKLRNIAGMLIDTLPTAVEDGSSVKILTDYDADGICFGYIMEKTIKAIEPNIDVRVICNDRRGSYGVPKDLSAEENALYIVGDMGSNELPYIQKTFGEDTIIIDHHLIQDDEVRKQFNTQPNLLNPHSMRCADGKSAEYCATGLAFRVYEEVKAEVKARYDYGIIDSNLPFASKYDNADDNMIMDVGVLDEMGRRLYEDKLSNSVGIVACIGTASDMVDVLDEHSYNRNIIKNGIELINNADSSNIYFNLGKFLSRAGIGEYDITAKKIAFNVGAFINSTSRMSEIIGYNGAQRMYNAFSQTEFNTKNYYEIEDLYAINVDRKKYVDNLLDDRYTEYINSHRFGEDKDEKIAIYILDSETPTAICGLVAGKLTEAIDKPSIVLTYHAESDTYTGSARNVSDGASLLKYVQSALSHCVPPLDISYGGHDDAFGISRIEGEARLNAFIELVTDYQDDYIRSNSEPVRLDLQGMDIKDPKLNALVQALEPTGTGFKLPYVEFEGKEMRHNQLFKGGREDWKAVQIKNVGDIMDWTYDERKYPTNNSGNVKVLATIELNDYKGLHAEYVAAYKQSFLEEQQKSISVQQRFYTERD